MAIFDSPILISGNQRTRSTAMAAALSSHPDVCILNESRLLEPDFAARDHFLVKSETYRAVLPYKFGRTGYEIGGLVRKKFESNASNKDVFKFLMSIPEKTPKVYGDKSPRGYVRKAQEMHKRYPKAKWILTIRDGRDVISSMVSMFKWSIPKAIDTYMETIDWINNTKKIVPKENIFELQCEHWIDKTDELAKKLFEFMGAKVTEEVVWSFSKIYRPQKRAVGSWKKRTPKIEKFFDKKFKKTLAQWGYK